jgi:hypothetical protein
MSSTVNKSVWAVTCAAAAVAVTVVALEWKGGSPSAHGDSAQREPASLIPSGASVSTSIHFKPEAGKRYVYSFDRAIHVSGMSNQIPDIQYGGKFYVDVISADASGFDAWARTQVTGHEQASPVVFKIHVESTGKSVEISAPELASQEAHQFAGILKDLVATWVFPLESDTMGSYQVWFSPMAVKGNFAHIEKRKIAYLTASAANGAKNKVRTITPEIVKSNHILEWDLQRFMPAVLQGEEVTSVGTGQMAFSSSAQYKMSFVEMVNSPAQTVTGVFHAEALTLTPDSATGRARARFTAADWPRLQQRIMHVAELSPADQLALFGDLTAFLRSQGGGTLGGLMGLLSASTIAAGPASPLFKLAVGALATSGSPEDQAALLQIYQDPNCPAAGRATILAAMTTTQATLTDPTRAFLLSESQSDTDANLSSAAQLALGSSLQNAPTTDPTAQTSIASIQQAWASAQSTAQSEPQEMNLLSAMGNSGNPAFLPILSNVIDGDGDSSLKSTAVYALRGIQSPDAVGILDRELSDPNPALRLAAANAIQIGTWNSSYQAPLQQCANSDSVGQVQAACQAALKRVGS